jgi:uncharacterized protein with HEPN domain
MRDKIGDKHRLQHILDAIAELDDFVEGVAFPDFEVNRMMQQACVRNLMIIGEAANHLTAETKDKYNQVDWSGLKGFRNIIVHEYFKVNTAIVWKLIHNNLPDIKQVIEQALKGFEEANS